MPDVIGNCCINSGEVLDILVRLSSDGSHDLRGGRSWVFMLCYGEFGTQRSVYPDSPAGIQLPKPPFLMAEHDIPITVHPGIIPPSPQTNIPAVSVHD